MSHAPSKRSHGFARTLRVLVAVLAIACQVGAGGASAMADAPDPQVALLAATAVLCQGNAQPANDHDAPQRHRHVPAQAILGALSTHGHAAALVNAVPALPTPASCRIGEVTLPGARAPPGLYAASSLPRGPPRPV
jgi:hypothetical protein